MLILLELQLPSLERVFSPAKSAFRSGYSAKIKLSSDQKLCGRGTSRL